MGAIFAVFSQHRRQISFHVLNLVVSWHFALKMSRLIIFSSVPCAVLSGIFLGKLIDKAWDNITWADPLSQFAPKNRLPKIKTLRWYTRIPTRKFPGIVFSLIVMYTVCSMATHADLFFDHCWESAVAHSQPQIVFHHFDGRKYVLVDDYRDSYEWLRKNTPNDARVCSWWDYGYHLNCLANRTSLADGNTWNHEHIALIGKCLCSPVDESHAIIRHLADYVLLWTGGGADDLAKSPWIARISNKVFDDICPNDPLCSEFRFLPDGSPSSLMEKSTLFSLQNYGDSSDTSQLRGRFEKVFSSKNRLVSIFKVLNVSTGSKEWVQRNILRKKHQEGGNRHGTYPPARELQDVLRRRKSM
uniref:STT3/PglB/AglB core domain-containing protein n=1 Tax=Paramoeba aestuarina TaxID=180227 RepID=A0A7S4UTL0_9EUKA